MSLKRVFLMAMMAVAGFVLAAGNASAYKQLTSQQVKTIIPSDSRTVVSLAGAWEKSTDGESWEGASLPLSEPAMTPVWYKKSIRIDKTVAESNRWQLQFLGFNHQAEIYFNDRFVGRYFGGLTPMSIKIPDKMILVGNNELKVKISPADAASKHIQLQSVTAKKVYTGILREAFLVGTPPIWISDIKYKTNFGQNFSSANINAKISISSGNIANMNRLRDSATNYSTALRKADVLVEVTLVKKSTGETVAIAAPRGLTIESERTLDLDFNLSIAYPSLWSPENPELYELRAKVSKNGSLIDNFASGLGFKDVRYANVGGKMKLVLNGNPYELKGVEYIEDHQSSLQSLSAYRMEEDIKMIKTLGANAIRFKYNAPSPYLAQLCDKYGLMMMIELPLYNVPTAVLKLDEIEVFMKNLAKQYINTYNNYVSLFAYGVSEGLRETPVLDDLSKQLSSIFKSSSNVFVYKVVPLGTKTLNADGFDFLGFSATADYFIRGTVLAEVNKLKELSKGMPFWLSFGVAVQPENHNGYSDPLSIEHQAFFIKMNYNTSREAGSIGNVISSFNDFELNHPYLTTNNPGIYDCTKGLVDRYRNHRLSFQTLQSLFNDEKEPLLSAGSYTEQTPISFIVFGILLVGGFLFLLNRYRRFREYASRALLRPYNFYSDIRDQRIISSVHTLLLGLLISFTIGIFLASVFYFYRGSETAQYFLMLWFPNNQFREILFSLIWMPELFMLVITVISFLIVFVISFIIKVFAFFLRARVFFADTMIITVWSGIPYLVLLPISIVLVRLLVLVPDLVLIVSGLYLLLNVWVSLRILKATSVVFDKQPLQVYLAGVIILILAIGIPIGIYQVQYSVFSYLQYFAEAMLKIA